MTLDELITDLKAAGANENTVRLAMNCYELGQKDEREACAKLCDEKDATWGKAGLWRVTHEYRECAAAIRSRGHQ